MFLMFKNLLTLRKIVCDETRVLGRGSNETVVFPGEFEGRKVAVKRIVKKIYKLHDREISLLKDAADSHENVITFYSTESSFTYHYLAFELCDTTLGNYVMPGEGFEYLRGSISDKEVLAQICRGLKHLHNLGIIHRDINPQNILIQLGKDHLIRVKISDFGISKILAPGKSTMATNVIGTETWMAPETLNEQKISKSSDIFSLGILFYYVITKGSSPIEIVTAMIMNRVNYKFQHNFEQFQNKISTGVLLAIDLIHGMTKVDPKARPTIDGVLMHPFFWNEKECLNFITDVAKYLEKNEEKSNFLQDKLEIDADTIIGTTWTTHIDECLLKELSGWRKYRNSMIDLIRAIRNKNIHDKYNDPEVKKIFGDTEESYMSYWFEKFPHLFLHIYQIVKMHAFFLISYKPSKKFTIFDLPKKVHFKIFLYLDLASQKKVTLTSKAFNQIITPNLVLKIYIKGEYVLNKQVINRQYETIIVSHLTKVTVNLKGLVTLAPSVKTLIVRNCKFELSNFIGLLNIFSGITKLYYEYSRIIRLFCPKPIPKLLQLEDILCSGSQEDCLFGVLMNSTKVLKIQYCGERSNYFVKFLLAQTQLRSLKIPNIRYNLFKNLPRFQEKLKFQLKEFYIYDNSHDDKGSALVNFIKTQNQLEKIYVLINMSNTDVLKSYYTHIFGLPSLKSLRIFFKYTVGENLNENSIINPNVEHLTLDTVYNSLTGCVSKKLLDTMPKLKTLKVNNYEKETIETDAYYLNKCINLESFCYSGINSHILKYMKLANLKHFHGIFRTIDEDHVKPFLLNNPGVLFLELSFNKLSDQDNTLEYQQNFVTIASLCMNMLPNLGKLIFRFKFSDSAFDSVDLKLDSLEKVQEELKEINTNVDLEFFNTREFYTKGEVDGFWVY